MMSLVKVLSWHHKGLYGVSFYMTLGCYCDTLWWPRLLKHKFSLWTTSIHFCVLLVHHTRLLNGIVICKMYTTSYWMENCAALVTVVGLGWLEIQQMVCEECWSTLLSFQGFTALVRYNSAIQSMSISQFHEIW